MRFLLALFLVLLMLPALAQADQLQDGLAAADRRDYQTALKLLQPLADQGNAEAQYDLGNMYLDGPNGKPDFAEAAKWYRKAADQGNVVGQFAVGNMYKNGHGVKKDPAEAAKWYRKAAEQGFTGWSTEAQEQLGVMYEYGQGVEKDYAEAYFWLSLMKKGHSHGFDIGPEGAAASLTPEQKAAVDKRVEEWGRAHAYGPPASAAPIRTPPPDQMTQARLALFNSDNQTALKILQPLAEQGNPDAQLELGFMYEEAHGVKRNWLAAAQWYRKAADQGNVEAQEKLGVIYTQDRFGIKQDYAEAMKWDRIAAERGRSAAAFNLGQLYLQGHGVKQDYAEAYFWLSVGAGAADNKLALLEAQKHLTPEQKAAVDQRLKQRQLTVSLYCPSRPSNLRNG
jgi:TPR repeat protein